MEDADVMESAEHHPSSAEHTEPVERNEAPGLQRASGDASSPSLPGSVELLTAFMQDMHTSGRTDSEIWKNCEARWLQLFSLVEKQCQEQITAQQVQFHQQIQLIQDEIKHLVKLQSSSNSWKSCAGDPSTNLANNLNLWGIRAGQSSGNFEGNKSIPIQCSGSGESEMGLKIQECLDDSISASIGYGTISLSQPNPVGVKYEQNGRQFEGCEVTTSKELEDLGFRLTFDGNENLRSGEKESLASKPDQPSNDKQFAQGLACSVTSEMHKVNEPENSKCKPLTSWAHKVKRSQPKKPSEEKESCNNSVQRNGQVEKICSSSSQMSFVGRKSDSPSSLFSDGSGLSYWKLDEKEMYHSLPETFEKGLSNMVSNNLAMQQPNSASESKLQSLKVIYQNKLREKDEWPAWSPPDQAHQSHPPEVWTLDPTIHMKPGHQNPDLPSSTFFKQMGPKVPFTPDSILESSSCSHSDRESFSRASNMNSPMSGSPNRFSRRCVSSVDLHRNHTFQNETNENANFLTRFSGAGMSPIESVIQSEDDGSSRTLTPTSDTRSLLLSGDDHELEYNASSSSAEHPVMLSRIRENLREKHARHISDLRDYYEAEIQNVKQQLDTSKNLIASEELRQANQNLISRCDQLEDALTEASTRLRTLENKNNALEIQVADWRERFHTVDSTSNILQERFEEMRASNKEKDNTISRLKSRLKELEETYQKSYKLSEEKDLRIKHEQKRFQDLLAEYESLAKEHERVKDTLSTTETKQTEANKEISELKRMNSKLEAQLKQMEQDNMAKFRHIAEDHIRITNAKLRNTDVSRRKWLVSGSEYSPFTGQPLDNDQSILDNKLQDTYLPNRFPSPPEKDISRESFSSSLMPKKGRVMPDTPIMRAFKEFEDGKVLKSWGTQTEKTDTSIKALNRHSTVGFVDSSCGTSESPERYKGQKQTRRFGSPSGQRSSSLPPSNRRSSQSATPTKREIMLMPVSVKYSPKRSPRENFSPGLSELLSNPNSVTRFDVFVDDQHNSPPSFQGRSPRKKLQFNSRDDLEEPEHTGIMTEMVTPGPSSEDTNTVLKKEYYPPVLGTSHETEFTCRAEMRTLDETERLFDALTQEKQRIEAALSRIPCSRGRLTLQAKYNKEALEDRLEKINRELGSIRMTLKKFHVLRTSANI